MLEDGRIWQHMAEMRGTGARGGGSCVVVAESTAGLLIRAPPTQASRNFCIYYWILALVLAGMVCGHVGLDFMGSVEFTAKLLCLAKETGKC